MKYTTLIAVLTFLTFVLDPVSSLPTHSNDLQLKRHLEPRIIEERSDRLDQLGKLSYFPGVGTPVEHPNLGRTDGCIPKLKPRDFSVEEQRLTRAIRRRRVDYREFVTNLEFVPE